MSELKIGTVVHLTSGQTAVVKKLLGEGGRYNVYGVEVAGKKMALKWYKYDPFSDAVDFYKNLNIRASNGAPSPVFIWPKDVTEKKYDSFGYIMDLRPKGYYEFGQFLIWKQKFASFFAVTTAAMDICEGFKSLHAQGFCFHGLNEGNFFINPQTGHVMICDDDNIFPIGEKSGFCGNPRYMAPEIVMGTKFPDVYSDRFSLSVILFLLFYLTHPFEGVKVMSVPCLTESLEKKIFGSDFLFICDPTDKSNQPVRGEQDVVIERWPLLPSILRRTFTDEFGKDKLRNPTRRFTEHQWLDVITIVRDSLICCPHCKKETFVKIGSDNNKCIECGKPIQITNTLSLDNRSLALTRGNKLYLDRDDNPDLQVESDPQDANKMYIRNLTSDQITVDTTKGTVKQVESNGILPVKAGLTLHIKVRGTTYKFQIK